MKSIEKLRDAAKIGGRSWLSNYADEIEREITELQASWAQEAREHADDSARLAELARENAELKCEIAERYIELPLDADGVPIHVGDSIEYPNGGRDVVRFITVNDNMPTFNESGWIASKCRHVKPRTIEDVLGDAIGEYERAPMDDYDAVQRIAAKYADEIRELMGVSE